MFKVVRKRALGIFSLLLGSRMCSLSVRVNIWWTQKETKHACFIVALLTDGVPKALEQTRFPHLQAGTPSLEMAPPPSIRFCGSAGYEGFIGQSIHDKTLRYFRWRRPGSVPRYLCTCLARVLAPQLVVWLPAKIISILALTSVQLF